MHSIGIDHFSKFVFPCNLKSDGRGRVAFVLKRASIEDNKYYSDLYLLRDEGPARLSSSGTVSDFCWCGDALIFPDLRKEKDRDQANKKLPLTVLQKLTLGGGEAEEFARFKMSVTAMEFISETEFYFTAVYDPRIEGLSHDDDEKAAKELKEEDDYIVLDEIPFWRNGQGVTNKKRNRLYRFSAGTITPITDEYTDVQRFKIIDDKGRVIFIATRFTDKMPTSNELFICDGSGSAPKNISLFRNDFDHGNFFVIAPDTLLLQGTDGKDFGINQNGDFFIYNFVTGERTLVDDSRRYSGGNSVGSDVKMGPAHGSEWQVDRNGKVYFVETIDDSSHIMALDPRERNITRITQSDGMIQEFVRFGEDFIAVAMRGNDGPELYRIEGGGAESRLTRLNAAAVEGYDVSTPESFTISPEAGVEIRGWTIKPAEFDPNRKYPVILDIHGGPKTVYGSVFFHEMQYWAASGYAVIFCNPRGSDGKGAEFADIRGKYGTIDYEDLMAFVDACLEKNPWMDAERMGVTGGSYGGFMTNWIIGHTTRFKAAASQRSISNWFSKSNTTDIGYYFNQDQMGVNAWSDPVKLWFHSPLRYADRVRTPTLFIHSEEDYRCWLAEGLQMFTALKFFGVEARMCVFRGENHELSRSGLPKHRVRRLREITEWFDRHLRNL